MSKKSKKSKKARKKTKKTKPRKRFKKSIFKRKKIGRRRKRVRKVRKKKLKLRKKPKIKISKIRIKVPRFGWFKKISFQGTINWILQPLFKSYFDYRDQRRRKKIERMEFERRKRIRQKKEEAQFRLEEKKKELQHEKKIEIERRKDLRKFILEGQALLRKEKEDEKRRLYESMQIQRRLDQFAQREAKEIADLESYSLRAQISEYSTVQDSIDKIRKKYQLIREAKIREKMESIGIQVLDADSKEDLFRKQKELEEQRQKVETVMQSFYRSAQSLIFQLNRKWLPQNFEIIRVIDRMWEENLFYIRFDNEIEDNWLMFIYLKDGLAEKQTIIVEDKTSEKYITKEFSTSSIFSFQNWMVDRWTEFLDREYKKRKEKQAN